jgi:hypothetical protein
VDAVSNFTRSYTELKDEAEKNVPKEVVYSPETERYHATFEQFITANFTGSLEFKSGSSYQPYDIFGRVNKSQIKPITEGDRIVKYDLSGLSEVDKIRLWTEYNSWSTYGRFKKPKTE